jgi:ADP-ribose pyrophosphatase
MDKIADRAAEAEVAQPEVLAKGFREYRRYEVTLRDEAREVHQTRDVLLGGKIAAVLPVDVARGEVVLIRQFRLPAHLATGKGDMVEIVAGRVEAGEPAEAAARRECHEEIGVAPAALVKLFSYLTTPGLTDEEVTVFVAAVDASAVPERTELGGEIIQTLRVPIGTALAALDDNTIRNGPALMALQWLAINRGRLQNLLG